MVLPKTNTSKKSGEKVLSSSRKRRFMLPQVGLHLLKFGKVPFVPLGPHAPSPSLKRTFPGRGGPLSQPSLAPNPLSNERVPHVSERGMSVGLFGFLILKKSVIFISNKLPASYFQTCFLSCKDRRIFLLLFSSSSLRR